MSMSMLASNLTVFHLILQIYNIKMTKNMVFVSGFGVFFFFFSMDDLALNDVTLILDTNVYANVSIETHMKYDKLLILRKKVTEDPI